MPSRKRTRSAGMSTPSKKRRDAIISSKSFKRSLWSLKRSPVPTTFATKLVYSDLNTLSSTGGLAGVHVYSANGLYDPDITGIGHQPRGFDQLMALFDHYTVIGAKITIQIADSDATASQPFISSIALIDQSSVAVDQNDYLESGYCVFQAQSGSNIASVANLTMAVNPNKFLGRSAPLADSQLKGSSTSNPTEQCYFHVAAGPLVSGTTTGTIAYVSKIEYSVVFSEPKVPSQS